MPEHPALPAALAYVLLRAGDEEAAAEASAAAKSLARARARTRQGSLRNSAPRQPN